MKLLRFLHFLLTLSLASAGGAEPVRSLQSLRQAVSDDGRAVLSLHLKGTICATGSSSGLIALQDSSSTEMLELPLPLQGLSPGQSIVLEGKDCTVTRGVTALQLGTAPVVEIDGYHNPFERAGTVFLRQGQEPVRVEWFNGTQEGVLKLEWEGPGLSRKLLEAADFSHAEGEGQSSVTGLRFAAYAGKNWVELPDFDSLQPAETGVSPALDISVRTQQENAGLIFTGELRVPTTGLYRFHLTSDDGGRFFAGRPDLTIHTLPEDAPRSPEILPLNAPVAPPPSRWVAAEGSIVHAAWNRHRLELELTEASGLVSVTVADPGSMRPEDLLHQRVRLSGVSVPAGIAVIDSSQLQILPPEREHGEVLTRIIEVRRLKPEEASRSLNVTLQGVVTMVNVTSLVLQDSSGGVFVHYTAPTSSDAPKVGEVWKIIGTTGRGDFSPVVFTEKAEFIRRGSVPRPARPTWEQLLSSSLDAEEVEVEGVFLESSPAEIRLLTREGEVRIVDHALYPLPTRAMPPAEVAALPGSVVRLRGVFGSSWDPAINRVHPAELKLGNATLAIDEPAPADPFAAPEARAADLLRFSSGSGALRRVRVNGQVLDSRPPDYLLIDGTQGFRVSCRDAPALRPGDVVDAVGFSRPGGPSPILVEAKLRKTGTQPLAAPVRLAAADLPDPRRDATRVEIEATLLSDSLRQDLRALELRSGENHFFAYLPIIPGQPRLEAASVLRLTGVYVEASADRSPANPDSFELRLAGPVDFVVLHHGPWWTPRHTWVLIGVLVGSLMLTAAWVTVLRRTVARRSRELAREIEERESVERHRMMEQERSRVAQDLHDELGSGLTEAGILTALLKNPAIADDVKNGYLAQLSGVCFSLVTGLDEIVWAVNPRYDSVADLAGYFSLFAQRFLDLAGIRCRLNIPDAMPSAPLDSSRRHGIFLAMKEALNNVVRHSGAGEVHLSIWVEEGMLHLSLSDDGHGFDPSVRSPGSDGLAGMRQRIESMGGNCQIDSAPGQGTKVRFDVSLERVS